MAQSEGERRPSPYLNPLPFLEALKGREVRVRLKFGLVYTGTLVNYDEYFNLQIRETKEWVDDQLMGEVGEMLLRCNNVLYVQEMD